MVIWRGLGFLAFILAAGGALLGVLLGSAITGGDDPSAVYPGLGLIIGGAASFALGWWLNVIKPAQKAAQWTTQRQAELQTAVASGQFQPSPGIVPASAQDAQAQADAMLTQESAHVTKRLRNIHTLFWIPMQWAGVVIVAIGVWVMISGLSSS
jgi:hypothetical protein